MRQMLKQKVQKKQSDMRVYFPMEKNSILEKYRELYGGDPDMVISGFHMMKHSEYNSEDEAIIKEIAQELKRTAIQLYTGHCTSEYPFQLMKEVLGDQLVWVHSGESIES